MFLHKGNSHRIIAYTVNLSVPVNDRSGNSPLYGIYAGVQSLFDQLLFAFCKRLPRQQFYNVIIVSKQGTFHAVFQFPGYLIAHRCHGVHRRISKSRNIIIPEDPYHKGRHDKKRNNDQHQKQQHDPCRDPMPGKPVFC